jgi:nitric oxide reductase subunit C
MILLVRAASVSGAVDGKKLFTEKACIACHSVGGPSNGPGPELTQVGYQRDAVWLHAWLTDPQKIKKGTIMPKPVWKSPQEMDAVVEYLLAAKRPIPAADSVDGAKLFADYECSACHSIHKKGGKPQFPDLAMEAKVHDAAWIDRWLQNPSAVKPGTFMATFPLTITQRKALVRYIESLDKK